MLAISYSRSCLSYDLANFYINEFELYLSFVNSFSKSIIVYNIASEF